MLQLYHLSNFDINKFFKKRERINLLLTPIDLRKTNSVGEYQATPSAYISLHFSEKNMLAQSDSSDAP